LNLTGLVQLEQGLHDGGLVAGTALTATIEGNGVLLGLGAGGHGESVGVARCSRPSGSHEGSRRRGPQPRLAFFAKRLAVRPTGAR
jgi:hypothetical protein